MKQTGQAYSKLLIKLRLNLLTVYERYNLDISIPTILNTPLTIDLSEEQKSAEHEEIDLTEEVHSESSKEIDINEKDLHDLTIPAAVTLSEEEEKQLDS